MPTIRRGHDGFVTEVTALIGVLAAHTGYLKVMQTGYNKP